MTTLTREELADRCASTSFDNLTMDYENKKVVYTHSFRDAQGAVLEDFRTEVHFSTLQPRPLTPAEQRALLSLGLCHSTYVFLAAAKRTPLQQIRAGYFSTDELAFFQPALAGALAEYFYLADLDLASFRLECCCSSPSSETYPLPSPLPSVSPSHSPAPAPQVAEVAESAVRQPDDDAGSLPETSTTTATAVAAAAATATTEQGNPPRVLVPFGGGKDSTLLMELLNRMGAQVGWVYYGEWVGSWEVYTKFARLAAASPAAGAVVLAEQHLPCLERLQELNQVPELRFQDYSAYVSFYTFSSAFVALQQDYDYICVGNEYSANAINTTHPAYNYPVNHQYEKSFEAERAFHAYLRDHIDPRLYYFSGLQHMTELEIAKRFAALCTTKYLDLIISCNWATDDHWCGGCEKCAFVFLLFAAFLPVAHIMSKIFEVEVVSEPSAADPGSCSDGNGDGDGYGYGGGSCSSRCNATSSPIVPGSRAESLRGVYDMYDSERHVAVFESLMGLAGHKPFECVGTPEECLAAMYLAYERLSGSCGGGGAAAANGAAYDRNAAAESISEAEYQETAGTGTEQPPPPPQPPQPPQQQWQQQKQNQQQQQEWNGARRLPLLLRKHGELICSRGKEEWGKIRAIIKEVELGRPSVPTLYPSWFQLGVRE